jgi:hypothetical protein
MAYVRGLLPFKISSFLILHFAFSIKKPWGVGILKALGFKG